MGHDGHAVEEVRLADRRGCDRDRRRALLARRPGTRGPAPHGQIELGERREHRRRRRAAAHREREPTRVRRSRARLGRRSSPPTAPGQLLRGDRSRRPSRTISHRGQGTGDRVADVVPPQEHPGLSARSRARRASRATTRTSLARRRLKVEPPGAEDSQEMPMGEQQHVSRSASSARAITSSRAPRPGCAVSPPGTPSAQSVHPGTVDADVGGAPALVVPVVPLRGDRRSVSALRRRTRRDRQVSAGSRAGW